MLRPRRFEQWPARGAGLDGELLESISMIDAFVAALQLGQVLLYELDGLTRAQSNTLWMRSTHITRAGASRPWHGSEPITTSLQAAKALPTAAGETWRTADVVSAVGDLTVRCAVAHRLLERSLIRH
ncbi:AvrD family protein [Streptomyces sp. NPDC017056]|uniref:AvrD family protein n=1 Tax=Streptomyces sp. NPDC017056 TaxID=3364973 RepID=UPI0037BA7B5E